VVQIKKFILTKYTELIQYKYKSKVAIPQELTLATFKPYFTTLSGKLTYFTIRKIFNQLHLVVEEALKDPISIKKIIEVKEWKLGNYKYEDFYQFSLLYQHFLIYSYIKHFPIPLTLIYPHWCIATIILAESN
jgi:hypothetical protein